MPGDARTLHGELQTQIMGALWRIESGTVEQVRSALPQRYRSAYTTVQTVLNRLVERRLLARRKSGKAMIYEPRFSEADYVSTSIENALASASTQAREAALARLIGGLGTSEISELRRLAKVTEQRRSAQR